MSKRRKTSILDLENELSTSKAKKSLRRKTKQIESNLETPVQTFQGEKLVPMFKKQRKMQTERHEGKFGETETICTEQVQHADRKGLDTTGNAAQNTVTSLKSPELMDLLGIKMEDTGKQEILHETLDFKMQDQDRISSLNYDDASSGAVDAHQIGTEPDLQAGICENEMPKKQISDFLNRPDNEDVDSPEKRKIPLKSLKCPFVEEMSVSKLEEGRITDHTESKQNQEHPRSLDIGMEQKKVSQNIIQSAHIREPNSTKNGSRKGIVLAECMLLQPQEKNSITQLPLVTHLSVSILGEPSKYPHTCSVARQENTDTKEPSQSHPYNNGKTEGQNGMYSNAEAKEQHNLWTTEKVAEQNGTGRVPVQISLCKKETNVAEQNSVKSQDTAWEVLPDTQSGCIYLGKEADLPETKCEIRNNLLLPQLDGDVQPVNRKVPVEEVVYREEWERDKKEMAMKTDLVKNTGASPDLKVPVLLAQQQQKENCCEKLVLNIKPELDKVDLRPSEITKALSNMSITQQILTKIPKPEIETTVTENSLCTPDVHLDGKEDIVTCVENKDQSGLSSVDILPILVRVGAPSREHKADIDTQKPLLVSDTFSKMTAPSSLDAEAQTHSPCSDPLSLDLEFLPDSQLHDIFERHQSQEIKFLDSPHRHSMHKNDHCAAKKQNGTKSVTSVVPVTHQKNARNVVMEKNSDPSKQQDTTDVVCGLIKELSNLNRLIMNTHRDLESFKRQKFWRNKQSGKLLHGMNNMTGTLSTLKKRREL